MSVPYAEVIGDPIAHSKSPLIHRFWLAKLGIDAEYRACHVRADDLAGYLARRREDAAWRGCNVTIPHKQAVAGLLDTLDPEAARIGAVNTVARGVGGLGGYNTDVVGVVEPLLKRPIGGYPNHVATYAYVIGAGGAARAAAAGAASLYDVEVFNRTVERAHAVAALAGSAFATAHPLDRLTPVRNPEDGPADQRYSHIVINATSMGMLGNPPVPIDLSRFYPDTIVFDMVYAPLETPLLAQARALGLRTIDGLEMLVAQATAAFARFFGAPAPRAHDAELRALLAA